MLIIIVIKGPAGVGKTTTCESLLPKLKDFEYVNLESLKTQFGHLDRAEKKAQAHAIYYPRIKKLIIQGKNILLQETFISDLKKELGADLELHNYRIISIFLKASLKETKRRNRVRDQKTLSDEYLEESYTYLAVPESGDKIINVETHSPQEVVAQILLLLK